MISIGNFKIKIVKKFIYIVLVVALFFAYKSFANAYVIETYIGDPPNASLRECLTLSTNPTDCLKQDFNVEVKGIEGYSPTDDFKRVIYRILWETSRSSTYRENIMRGGKTLEIYIQRCETTECISSVKGDITLNLRPSSFRYSASLKRLLIHETGHVIRRRAAQVYGRFDVDEAVRRDGTDCYERSFVKSYGLRNYSDSCNGSRDKWSVTPESESFAEAIGNYQFSGGIGGGYLCSQRITNFKTSCSYTYGFMRDNIFGGYEFY